MKKYALLLSYVGTPYCGWQRQAPSGPEKRPSVQGVLEETLFKLSGERVAVVGSGRTDSGVHASNQVAHFIFKKKIWNEAVLFKGLNSILPRTIQALQLQEVPLDFHAQKSAIKKQYSYYFQQGASAIPHYEPLSWWIRKRLDLEALRRALQVLVGEHNFKPFQARGSRPGSTIRKIFGAEVSFLPIAFPHSFSQTFGLIRIQIIGSGFLKQMARGIAGTLLQIGEGRRPPEAMSEILVSQERSQVGPTAPARALWLEKVWYPNLKWED
jgi:tRNA pseudouridine38-40 synthase